MQWEKLQIPNHNITHLTDTPRRCTNTKQHYKYTQQTLQMHQHCKYTKTHYKCTGHTLEIHSKNITNAQAHIRNTPQHITDTTPTLQQH